MILTLFWAIFLISALLITLGIVYSNEWSGVAIIGFTFLFLISWIILTGNLEVQSGLNVTSSYGYAADGAVNSTQQSIDYKYENWTDSNSHTVGYFLAILSGIGAFSSVLITLTKWRKK